MEDDAASDKLVKKRNNGSSSCKKHKLVMEELDLTPELAARCRSAKLE